jgi:hypothetical protein
MIILYTTEHGLDLICSKMAFLSIVLAAMHLFNMAVKSSILHIGILFYLFSSTVLFCYCW